MIIVIQCAASKRAGAGRLVSNDGKPVVFVANPQAAPVDRSRIYARPDDPSGTGMSWRQVLVEYNKEAGDNPLNLFPAWRLYENKVYERLVDRLGVRNVYILSAGWGLIAADFLTPYYDITFSQSVEGYKRRRKTDPYNDFRMLPADTAQEVLFFGGKEYLPLFDSLTNAVKAKRTIFYNSAQRPELTGCVLSRFETTTRTNWHYECASAFLSGEKKQASPG